MSYYHQAPPPGKDPQLWYIAQKRASFKYHVATYIIINAFFWGLWYFSGKHESYEGWPWPIWPMIGWGDRFIFSLAGGLCFTKREFG